MKTFLLLRCALFLFFFGSSQNLQAAVLHALLVGDCTSVDIRQASKADLENFQNELYHISMLCNLELNLQVITDYNHMADKVLYEVKKLKPAKKDIVFFYFSGHGYRTSTHANNPWPNMDFPMQNRGISLKSIIEIISQKNASLSIIFADCCNWLINSYNAPPVMKRNGQELDSSRIEQKNTRKLFCRSKGVVAIVSSSRGQAAYCKPVGSFYSLSFLYSLHKVICEEKHVSWQKVVNLANKVLQPLLEPHQLHQDPFSVIQLE